MVKTLQGKLNNKGSSLVAVIIAMGFISILGASALVVGVMGYQMKMVEAGTKESQYSAEATLNRLCSGLQEVAENKMEEAYTFALTRYSATEAEGRANFAKEKYIDFMDAYLRAKAGASESAGYTITEGGRVEALRLTDSQRETLITWLDSLDETDTSGFVLNNGVTDVLFKRGAGENFDDYSVTLTNITTRYKDGTYETGITTDIKLSASDMAFSETTGAASSNSLAAYGIIADGMVNSETTTRVKGDVYAGKGLCGESGADIVIEAGKVLSRGTIETKGGASLKIKGTTSEEGVRQPCDVWADNIRTTAVRTNEEGDRNPIRQLDLEGVFNIANDMTLNNPIGNVYLSGEYYGYGLVQGMKSVTYGSSIGINAPKAQLDLSKLDKLHLAGRASIGVEATDETSGLDAVVPIMQGESLSYMWSQNAYLLPGDCLPGIGHNPMTLEEHETIFKALTGADKFNITRYVPVALRKYLNPTNPYTEIFVKHYINDTETNIMVYLYMNFMTPNYASTYFQEYAQNAFHKNELEAIATMLGFKGTILNPNITATNGSDDKLQAAGNVVGYQHGSLNPEGYIDTMGEMVVSSGALHTENVFSNMAINKTYSRNGLVSYLDDKRRIANPTATLTENLIHIGQLTTNPVGVGKEENFIAQEGDLLVPTSFTRGVILVDGDVTINSAVTGLVVATGNITVNDGTITADPTVFSTLINSGIDVQKYFKVDLEGDMEPSLKATNGEETTDSMKYDRVVISFENWRKA